jgi:hypothetical protein
MQPLGDKTAMTSRPRLARAHGPRRDGVALTFSALVALGSEACAGLGVEGGVSYFGDHFELGVGLLLMALWASESGFHDLYESASDRGRRENRDLVLMPEQRKIKAASGDRHFAK